MPERTAAKRFPPVARCLKPGVDRLRRTAKMMDTIIQKMPAELRPQTFV
jgi:hypothetical protein